MNQHLRRTPTHLADGRELVYFDDSPEYVSGERTRRLDDPRPLPDRFAPVPGPALRRLRQGERHPKPTARAKPLSRNARDRATGRGGQNRKICRGRLRSRFTTEG